MGNVVKFAICVQFVLYFPSNVPQVRLGYHDPTNPDTSEWSPVEPLQIDGLLSYMDTPLTSRYQEDHADLVHISDIQNRRRSCSWRGQCRKTIRTKESDDPFCSSQDVHQLRFLPAVRRFLRGQTPFAGSLQYRLVTGEEVSRTLKGSGHVSSHEAMISILRLDSLFRPSRTEEGTTDMTGAGPRQTRGLPEQGPKGVRIDEGGRKTRHPTFNNRD